MRITKTWSTVSPENGRILPHSCLLAFFFKGEALLSTEQIPGLSFQRRKAHSTSRPWDGGMFRKRPVLLPALPQESSGSLSGFSTTELPGR